MHLRRLKAFHLHFDVRGTVCRPCELCFADSTTKLSTREDLDARHEFFVVSLKLGFKGMRVMIDKKNEWINE